MKTKKEVGEKINRSHPEVTWHKEVTLLKVDKVIKNIPSYISGAFIKIMSSLVNIYRGQAYAWPQSVTYPYL